jgi:hypothetical protein
MEGAAMETEIRMVGWPKRECEVIPVAGMTRKDIMGLTNCPYMTAVTAEKRGYFILDYLKKGVPPKRGFVDGPIDLGREREVIPIPEDMNSIEAVMAHFGCTQKRAKASLARGYFILGFNQRTICPDIDKFDAAAAYRMVRFIYQRKFKDRLPWYIEAQDLIQEGVTRLLELSGHPHYHERKFMFLKAYGFMGSYIQSQGRLRGSRVGGEDPGYEQTWRRNAGNDWQGAMAAA